MPGAAAAAPGGGVCAGDPAPRRRSCPRRLESRTRWSPKSAAARITLKELDAKWEEFDAAERARVTQLLYQNRRNMLEQLVGDILIENAAKGGEAVGIIAAGRREAAQPVTEAESRSSTSRTRSARRAARSTSCAAQIKDFLERSASSRRARSSSRTKAQDQRAASR